MRGIPRVGEMSNVAFDPTPLPRLEIFYLTTGGSHHRLIFNIPPGLVFGLPEIVTALLPKEKFAARRLMPDL